MFVTMNWVVIGDLISLIAGIVMGASLMVPRRRSGRRYDY
jgi:hypothetical protein